MANNKNNFDKVNWPAILLHLKKQKLVPFLGAGASFSANGTAGLPGGRELAESLAEECEYPGMDKTDLLRVAQYYALTVGEMPLRESVNEKVSLPDVKPGEIHNILAGWPIEVVLTTNFDNLMERALSRMIKMLQKRFTSGLEIRNRSKLRRPSMRRWFTNCTARWMISTP